MSLLRKVKSGMGFSPDWNVSMVDIHLRNLLWVYWPGHAGVKGNNPADTLAGKAILTSGLLLEISEVLRSLRHYLWAKHITPSIAGTNRRGHKAKDNTPSIAWSRGKTKRKTIFKGRERASVSQTNTGTVSNATLGKLLRDVDGAYMSFSERADTTLTRSELTFEMSVEKDARKRRSNLRSLLCSRSKSEPLRQ